MLYTSANELNDVFNLTISYPIGYGELPQAERLASYLTLLGSKTMDYDEHRAKLQAPGGSLGFTAEKTKFKLEVSGFDSNFKETMDLVLDLFTNIDTDRDKLSILKENEMMNKIMSKRDMGTINEAIIQYATFGEDSYYMQDKGRIDNATLIKSALAQIQSIEFDIHYSGKLEAEQLAKVFAGSELVKRAVNEHKTIAERNVSLENRSAVFFVNKKRAPQSKITALVLGSALNDYQSRFASEAFSDYFGGGMGSVLFQEIRELRSMAYSTGSTIYKPTYCNRADSPSFLKSYLSTQCDKTIDAMTVVDSLLTNIPLSETRAKTGQQKPVD